MTKRVPTGVSPLGVVLALAMIALVPRAGYAAAITVPTGINPDPLTGDFQAVNEVAFFQFTLVEGSYNFSALTDSLASGGFDPYLALYLGTELYSNSVEDGFAVSDDRTPGEDFEAFLSFVLDRPGDYTLALAYSLNEAKPNLGFTWDDFPDVMGTLYPDVTCEIGTPSFGPLCGGTTYSLQLEINPVDSSPVPEPGTLSLLALGSLATAFVRRRRTRTNSIRK